MMYGFSPVDFEGPFHDFLFSSENKRGGAITVKVKNDMVVIYNKRSQTAITCYQVPGKYMPWEEYLLSSIKKKAVKKEYEEER